MLNNFLTFDIEEWYDGEFTRNKVMVGDRLVSGIDDQVSLIIDVCDRFKVKATCFVTGRVAERKPSLVRRLSDNGHEIASHSYSHRMICGMTPTEFSEDLARSIDKLSDITGKAIIGFRAPSWSVSESILSWYYEILSTAGVKFSSSIYPGHTSLYGIPDAITDIHYIGEYDIVEIPQQLMVFGNLRSGFAGGAFFRLLPRWMITAFIEHKNMHGKPVFIYIHPWELKSNKYPVKLNLTEHMLMHWGVKWNLDKLNYVMTKYASSFILMGDYSTKFRMMSQAN